MSRQKGAAMRSTHSTNSVAEIAEAAISAIIAGCGRIGTKSPRRFRTALILSAVACLCSPALAQWHPSATAKYGRGLGSIALSQGNLTLGRLALRDRASARRTDARPSASMTPAQIEAALTYTADPQLSEKIRLAMIDAASGPNPTLRPKLEEAFADGAALKEFERLVSAHGYSSRNVADSMAALLWNSGEIVFGSKPSDAQIRGVDQQVRGVFLNTPGLRAMTNADRQLMAERSAYLVMLSSAAAVEALRSGDQAQLAQLRQSVVAMVLQQAGVDMSRLRLTDNGFRQQH
jgi:hypothetical protein